MVAIVDDVAQPEDGLRAEGARDLEGRAELAADAERVPVHEHDLRLEGLGGRREQPLAQLSHLAARQRQPARARAVVALLESGQLEDADARGHAEALGLLRTGDEEHGGAGADLDELSRDGQAAAHVPEPESVVRVEEKSPRLDALGVRRQGEDRVSEA